MLTIKGNEDKFESVEEFIDNMHRGGEVEFLFNNKRYSITRTGAMMCLIEIGHRKSEKVFCEINELLDHKIEDQRVRDIITIIEPYFRCF